MKDQNEVSFKTECRCEHTCVIRKRESTRTKGRQNLLLETVGSFLINSAASMKDRPLMQHWEPLGDFFFKYSDFSLKIRAHGQIIEIYLLTFYGNFVQ